MQRERERERERERDREKERGVLRPRERKSESEGDVKEYVNYVNMPEYGLDCQISHSKSCVVNDG